MYLVYIVGSPSISGVDISHSAAQVCPDHLKRYAHAEPTHGYMSVLTNRMRETYLI